jgi:hypothetical protein
LKLHRIIKITAITVGAYVIATQVFGWVWADPPEESADQRLARFDLLDQISAVIGAETYRGPLPPPKYTKVERFGFRMWNLV